MPCLLLRSTKNLFNAFQYLSEPVSVHLFTDDGASSFSSFTERFLRRLHGTSAALSVQSLQDFRTKQEKR